MAPRTAAIPDGVSDMVPPGLTGEPAAGGGEGTRTPTSAVRKWASSVSRAKLRRFPPRDGAGIGVSITVDRQHATSVRVARRSRQRKDCAGRIVDGTQAAEGAGMSA